MHHLWMEGKQKKNQEYDYFFRIFYINIPVFQWTYKAGVSMNLYPTKWHIHFH